MEIYLHHLKTWPRQKLEAAIRRRVQAVYLGDDVVLARILGRPKIFLSAKDRGFGAHLMLDGYWEMWLTQYLANIVKPGMTVIDVGANFGYFTLLFADVVGPQGEVVAVEPNSSAMTLLRETVLLNGFADRVKIVPEALSASEGSGFLFVPEGEPKNATLVAGPGLPGGNTVEVPTVTLDQVSLSYRRVHLVKIDAEGGEFAIVAGMQKLIDRDQPIIVLEFNPARYANPRAFLDMLLPIYGSFQELRGDGTLLAMDIDRVVDLSDREDRILIFG